MAVRKEKERAVRHPRGSINLRVKTRKRNVVAR
jgi:hypothetical protein